MEERERERESTGWTFQWNVTQCLVSIVLDKRDFRSVLASECIAKVLHEGFSSTMMRPVERPNCRKRDKIHLRRFELKGHREGECGRDRER
jgi:hypothetical protein